MLLRPATGMAAVPDIRIDWPDPSIRVQTALADQPRPPPGSFFTPPESLRVDAESKLVRACGRLTNPLPTPIGVRYFSANPDGPMILLAEEGKALRRRPPGPGELPPPLPAPPPPMRFELPAHSTLEFCADVSLSPFDFDPGSEARFRWHFDWKNPPAGHSAPLNGELTIRLP